MADKNPNLSEIENLRERELDRMLDAALAGYSAVEPRAGLEDRIVANLRVEQRRPPNRAWWQWSLAAALATVVLVVLTLAWKSGSRHAPVISTRPPVRVQNPEKTNSQACNCPVFKGIRRHDPVRRAAALAVSPHKAVAANPKLETFPSPQPLNEQERMLELYVAQFHDEAVIVAELRTEASIRERQEEMQDAEKDSKQNSQTR